MKWIINIDNTSPNKLRINFDPPNSTLSIFFSSLKTIDFPSYILQSTKAIGSFGIENTSILYYDQLDWEDKEGLNINEDDIYIYIYNGMTNETILKQDEFNNILYNFSTKILEINILNKSLPKDWIINMNKSLKQLSDKKLKNVKLYNDKSMVYVFFDGLKSHNAVNQYDDWLSSTDYSVWSNSYIEIENKKIHIIKENVKKLSTFRFFNKEELESLAKKYTLKIKEENDIYYLYTDNHESRQFEISENDELAVIYSMEGGNIPESIFIYGVFEK